ncbi:MAG: dephospho-CoA kinase [Bryobacteraceae bacterium]
MLRVGLTGGLASGKSYVGEILSELGCFLIRADQLGHEVLERGGAAYDAVIHEFGAEIVLPDGAIDRKKLAGIVFNNPEQLKKLTSLVHPPVRAKTDALLAEFAAREPDGIAVVEAAILIETGRYKDFDRLILALCSPELQIERAMARDHATREEVQDRMKRQKPLEEKLRYANYVIETSGTKAETAAKVRDLHQKLLQIARHSQARSQKP